MSTCIRLDLETLGSQSVMPTRSPESLGGKHRQENVVRYTTPIVGTRLHNQVWLLDHLGNASSD